MPAPGAMPRGSFMDEDPAARLPDRRRRSEHAAVRLLQPAAPAARGLRDRPAQAARPGDLRRPERDRVQGDHHRRADPRGPERQRRHRRRRDDDHLRRAQQVDFSTRLLRRRSAGAGARRTRPPAASGTSAASGSARRSGRPRSQTLATLTPRADRRTPSPQRTDCLVALQQGLVDAISSDDAILLGFQAQDPVHEDRRAARSPTSRTGWRSARRTPSSSASSTGCSRRCAATARGAAIYHNWLGAVTNDRDPRTPEAAATSG